MTRLRNVLIIHLAVNPISEIKSFNMLSFVCEGRN
jgi:hypothetical protein